MTPGSPGRLIRSLAALVLLATAVAPALAGLADPEPLGSLGLLPDRALPPRGGVAPARLRGIGAAPTVDIRRTGDPANRITLVLLGDGYTAAQQDLFHQQADQAWRALMDIEPFRSYRDFFNIRRVDVVSPTSGIAETDGRGARPATPLGMHFWCEGTARLLCADEAATARYAGPGEGPQYLIALANSVEYGGAGGTGVTTLAGGSPDAGRIIQHEIGHTVGDLGDEYDSAPTDTDYPNLSGEGADAMRRDHAKWWRWLGAQSPDGGGEVGAYRSANGVYRPTEDSVMRTLGGSYNLPSREAILEQLYRRVSPLDGVDPRPGQVSGRPRLTVRPLTLEGGRRLQVQWKVDGHPVASQAPDQTWLDPAALGLPAGHRTTVTATVRDTTDWVRDEAFRDQHMTRTVSWTLAG
ncbi:M64 family metallopeptidase [Kitasatospora viridis]|uniref:IgA peptidase n=1 Tax=Kitasatospora viridis TaxID=281105 RepID=A0A561UHN2_9ACTN|nr:M64 family metallopeptidase [Kitasatospora viridis]TWF98863.1 IgA peptidase [Kitasatospora viridis]